ncbi:P-loop containing nucleoside triphosphate hydrolase protein [Pelagophyceae sp. CCMP2097]|nr:P-loop containing nucleoside triphosphate hydrolase protein [Pelagophyceae sp. CCMP2097]|mmetsp:Transcript_22560/g.80505  ORF Transcript_22560/g.80505 Transcript_22560/m.80505 type:complete len:462 (+) Transcript_22560:61-1446(+)
MRRVPGAPGKPGKSKDDDEEEGLLPGEVVDTKTSFVTAILSFLGAHKRAAAAALLVIAAVAFLADYAHAKSRRAESARKAQERRDCVFRPRRTVERAGLGFVNKRPVVSAADAWCAVDSVDAGYCVEDSGGGVRCLPSFIIAGAQKAATGWLRQRLAPHPRLAQNGGKELHFFDKLGNGPNGLARAWRRSYLKAFQPFSKKDVKTTFTYEKTPDYMPNATAMAALRRLLPSVRLVFLLRSPTPRAYSAYQHHCRRNRLALPQGASRPIFALETAAEDWAGASVLPAPCSAASFDAFVAVQSSRNSTTVAPSRIVSWGLYAQQLKAIRQLGFDDASLLVIFSELALGGNSNSLLDAVVEWLGLDPFNFGALPTYRDALNREQLVEPGLYGAARRAYLKYNYNMYAKHSNEPMLKRTRDLLDAHFRRPNKDLDSLLIQTAPGIAVYPPRDKSRTTLLPPSWSR